MKKTVSDRELEVIRRREEKYLKKNREKRETLPNRILQEKVPPKLQGTLNKAFSKAFALVFDKGTAVIEKTYSKDRINKDVKVREYALQIKEDRRSLREFSKKAGMAGAKNLLLSGAEGIGLGILGVGLPDIPLFTGVLLRSLYETAMQFGYEYESEQERFFLLHLIQGALSYGKDLEIINRQADDYIERGVWPKGMTLSQQSDNAAMLLADELLYMKFLQGIPVAGALGGAADALCLKKVLEYSRLKYRKRFLLDHKFADEAGGKV